VPTLPTHWLRGGDERLEVGGVVVELKHRGGAHTPGDTIVWLPAQRVHFSGDVVYVDRLLGVLPMSRTKAWLDTFAAIKSFDARPFAYLLNAAELMPGNASRVYLELERE
jgi:glyoxylase-like metal-dependent hydrolase (beta-lactamase superfamily II)